MILYFNALLLTIASIEASGIKTFFNVKETTGGTVEITSIGKEQHVITDSEAKRFKIYGPDCTRVFGQVMGKNPDDCYLRELTPWTSYPTHGWQEVTSYYRPISAKLLTENVSDVAVHTQIYNNMSSKNKTMSLQATKSLKQSLSNVITEGGERSAEISLGYFIFGEDIAGEISYTHNWGQERAVTNLVSIEFSSGNFEIEVMPGQRVQVKYIAKTFDMSFQVNYGNYINGHMTGNYNPKFNDHHFWAIESSSHVNPSSLPLTEKVFWKGYASEGTINVCELDSTDNCTEKSFNVRLVKNPRTILHD